MADAEQYVNEKISSKKVVMFSKPGCPFCNQAKQVLAKYNLSKEDYEVIELSSLPNGSAVQAALQKITGARTVPRVFINGKCIGGGSETAALESSGELKKLLQDAGAI